MITVTAAIIADNGKVFIARRKPAARLGGLWEFPGGKLEEGETPEQCLRRELREEFSIDVKVGPYLATSVYTYDFGTIALMAYKVGVIKGDFKLNDHAEWTWSAPHNLDRFEFAPADLPFVEMIGSGGIEL